MQQETGNNNNTTDRDGIGSTYGGTQSPDPKAPDGNQKPNPTGQNSDKEKMHDGLGDEYESKSSYGRAGKTPDQPQTDKKDDGQTEEGSPVR